MPDETEDDVLSLLHDEGGRDVDDSAADRLRRLDRQVQVLYFVVDVVAFEVDGCGGNGRHFAEDSRVDKLAEWGKSYQRMTPSPTASKISF